MNDTRNITIFLLLVTAGILTAMLIGTYVGSSDRAYADTSVKQDDYIMVTGALSNSRDNLYVVDIAARKLNVYEVNLKTRALEVIDSVDLERAFAG